MALYTILLRFVFYDCYLYVFLYSIIFCLKTIHNSLYLVCLGLSFLELRGDFNASVVVSLSQHSNKGFSATQAAGVL